MIMITDLSLRYFGRLRWGGGKFVCGRGVLGSTLRYCDVSEDDDDDDDDYDGSEGVGSVLWSYC